MLDFIVVLGIILIITIALINIINVFNEVDNYFEYSRNETKAKCTIDDYLFATDKLIK